MKLTLLNKSNLELDGFCDWLIGLMQEVLRDQVDPIKMLARDELLNKAINFTVKQKISSEVLIKLAINNLTWKRSIGTSYEIGINDKITVYGTRNTLYEVAKYLEYGSREMPPLYLFRGVFDAAANNLSRYYEDYLELIGG